MSSTSLLRSSFRLQSFQQLSSQINLNQSKKLIIIGPPLIIGSIYLIRKLFIYLKNRPKTKQSSSRSLFINNHLNHNNNNNLDDDDDDYNQKYFDVIDYSQITTPDTNTSSLLNHQLINENSIQKTNKCLNCLKNSNSNQKLSFKDNDILEISLKNLSTTQLIKFNLDKLNNVQKSLNEMKLKKKFFIINNNNDNNDENKKFNYDNRLNALQNNIELIINEFTSLRNDLMPLTHGQQQYLNDDYNNDNDDDDFDDQASYLSSTTTLSLGYWDPEPNLHFFQLYQDSLKQLSDIKPPKTDRTIMTGCENYNDFLAKVNCLRQAFTLIFLQQDIRNRYIKIGEDILRMMLDHSLRVTICDSDECIRAYYKFLDFIQNEENYSTIEMEISARKIAMVSFYDIVLDYMFLESFDDLENPPSAFKSIICNQWLSSSFREIALQTAVSTVMRTKRTKLIVKNGFFEHFYRLLDHLSPILAWGFLGTDDNLKFKCESMKESLQSIIQDYFSFDRCRYTYLDDLCNDIKRVTEERFWELNNKIRIIQNIDDLFIHTTYKFSNNFVLTIYNK